MIYLSPCTAISLYYILNTQRLLQHTTPQLLYVGFPLTNKVIVMAVKQGKGTDWFESLDKELDKKTEKALKNEGEESGLKDELNRTLISDFWKILLRFERINVHFSMEPTHTQFAQFERYPYEWSLKEQFDYGGVNLIQILDRTRDKGRVGDTLRLRYYKEKDKDHLRLTFEYCEGEHYYKYSGWKRIFGQFVLLDSSLKTLDMDQMHGILADVVRVWYDSHLKHDRDMFLAHMKETYEKGETYTK